MPIQRRFMWCAEIVRTARIAMLKDFVPLNLGFNHTSRESIVDHHTTDISKQLFTDPISDTVFTGFRWDIYLHTKKFVL